MQFWYLWICFVGLINFVVENVASSKPESEYFKLDLKMPQAISNREDDLLCHSYKLDQTQRTYILQYEPQVSSAIAHHMMIYGCVEPATTKPYWSCRDVENPHSLCKDGSKHIVYAWALDAPAKVFPEGVGLRVGGDTPIQYLVLQMHYRSKFTKNQTDSSGIILHMTRKQQPFQAGFYLLGNWGYVPAKTRDFHLESACVYDGDHVMHLFAYRTHSHDLGIVTSGYRIRHGNWEEIGRMSPQQPQMFYDVTNRGMKVKKGDILAARCTMTNTLNYPVIMGSTNHDEMCNFYVMYYTNRTETLDLKFCFKDAQTFHWIDYFENIPEKASSLNGVNILYEPLHHKEN